MIQLALLLLLQAAATPAPAPPAAPGPWTVTTRTTAQSTATSTTIRSADDKARLVVRCDRAGENIVSVQFIPTPGFAKATPRPVSLKADEGSWLGTNWQFPGNGAFISDDVVVTTLTVAIAQAKSIRVRVIDPADVPVEAVFAGPPGEGPVRQVLTACSYDFGKVPPRSMPIAPPAKPAGDAEPATEEAQ